MGTTNYNLPIVEGSDKPTWLTTFNQAMNTIDSTLKNIADKKTEDVTEDINQIKSDISAIKTQLAKLVNVVIVGSSANGITATQYSNLETVSVSLD